MQDFVEPGCPHKPADLWQMGANHERKRIEQECSNQEGRPGGPRSCSLGWSQRPATSWLILSRVLHPACQSLWAMKFGFSR